MSLTILLVTPAEWNAFTSKLNALELASSKIDAIFEDVESGKVKIDAMNAKLDTIHQQQTTIFQILGELMAGQNSAADVLAKLQSGQASLDDASQKILAFVSTEVQALAADATEIATLTAELAAAQANGSITPDQIAAISASADDLNTRAQSLVGAIPTQTAPNGSTVAPGGGTAPSTTPPPSAPTT